MAFTDGGFLVYCEWRSALHSGELSCTEPDLTEVEQFQPEYLGI